MKTQSISQQTPVTFKSPLPAFRKTWARAKDWFRRDSARADYIQRALDARKQELALKAANSCFHSHIR